MIASCEITKRLLQLLLRLHELEVTKLIASFGQTWKFHNILQIEMAAQVLPRSDPYCGTNVPCGHMQGLASPKKVYFILLMRQPIYFYSSQSFRSYHLFSSLHHLFVCLSIMLQCQPISFHSSLWWRSFYRRFCHLCMHRFEP